jgi:ATP-binding cassette subfamily B protein/subfamily B ATP-binding cassette protein MsbA
MPQLVKAFWRFAEGQRVRLGLALGLASIATLLNLGPLAAPLPIIDSVIGDKPLPEALASVAPFLVEMDKRTLLTVICVGLVISALIAASLSIAARWTATKAATRIRVHVRRLAYERSVKLPLHRVFAIKSGGVASLLRDDANGVGDLVFSMVYNPWLAVVQLLASVSVLVWIDWRLLLGAAFLLPMVWYSNRLWTTRIRPHWRDIRKTRQGIDGRATETFGGMRVVRAFGRRRSETSSYTADSHFMARQELHNWWWMRSIETMWALLVPLASAALLYFGGRLVLDAQLTVGQLVTFLTFLAALLGPIATLANSATAFQGSLAGMDRTLDLLDETPEFADTNPTIVLNRDDVAGRVTLEDLSFSYAADRDGAGKEVLSNVDLDVAPGETIAFVGPSGAGKTTLCNLIARFYDPTGGRVLLDGVDLRDIHVESYRNLLAIVEQDTFLFDGTVGENIAYGRRNASRGDIAAAAQKANAHGFIADLPRGYDTHIGERGVKLSGGQRQRLTIARAILADPKILILDEATSNLDTESERLIQQSLTQLMTARTSFVIAHRLSTIRHADRIVVIDHGGIAEQGTHDELLAKSGAYQRMVLLQTEAHA